MMHQNTMRYRIQLCKFFFHQCQAIPSLSSRKKLFLINFNYILNFVAFLPRPRISQNFYRVGKSFNFARFAQKRSIPVLIEYSGKKVSVARTSHRVWARQRAFKRSVPVSSCWQIFEELYSVRCSLNKEQAATAFYRNDSFHLCRIKRHSSGLLLLKIHVNRSTIKSKRTFPMYKNNGNSPFTILIN